MSASASEGIKVLRHLWAALGRLGGSTLRWRLGDWGPFITGRHLMRLLAQSTAQERRDVALLQLWASTVIHQVEEIKRAGLRREMWLLLTEQPTVARELLSFSSPMARARSGAWDCKT